MIVAIDPGVKTGIAIWSKGIIVRSGEYPIWDVFKMLDDEDIEMVLLEDARLNKIPYSKQTTQFKREADARIQGAGWIKALCGQYEKFCKEKVLKYRLIKPDKVYLKKDISFVKVKYH